MNNHNYIVYRHTSPNGKIYIGITCGSMTSRAGKNGRRYSGNEHFYRAIQKYGWDNFQHDILYSNLTKEEACELETSLIAEYKANQYDFGYNICDGGEGRSGDHQSDDTKKLISVAAKEQWKNPIIRQRHIESLRGREVTQETRNKIRDSQIGKYVPPEVGRKISEAKKGKHPWNYGKKCGPRSDETKAKLSAYNKGKTISQEQRGQISKKLKGREITPEWREKISNTLKQRNAERRAQQNENL